MSHLFTHNPIAARSRATSRGSHGESAFSLTEVSFAILVVGVLIAAILSTVTNGFDVLSRSRETLRGNQILQQELETIRTYTWSQMTNTANFGSTNVSDSGVVYTVTRNATPYTTTTSYCTNNMRKVTVVVVWTNMTGEAVTKSMTTLVTQRGLNDFIY